MEEKKNEIKIKIEGLLRYYPHQPPLLQCPCRLTQEFNEWEKL